MGLLDDAIKEHLELKRRRGADPGEVEKLEREALGPVRRGPQPSDEAFAEQEAGDEGAEPALYDDRADEEFAEPSELADEPAFAEHAVDDEHEPFPEDESEHGWSHEPAEGWAEEPVEPEDHATEVQAEPAAPAPAPPAPEHAVEEEHPGEETVEYDVEAEEIRGGEREEDPKREDDVLEETPEFLQDTPDHDRLWFEQRPPKDFDFDK
jgi:hypothetical protein